MKKIRKYGLILAGLVLVGIVVVIVAQAQQGQSKQFFGKRGRGAPDAPVPVLAAQAKLSDVPVYLDGVGTTRALNTVTVRPQVDGKLIIVRSRRARTSSAATCWPRSTPPRIRRCTIRRWPRRRRMKRNSPTPGSTSS